VWAGTGSDYEAAPMGNPGRGLGGEVQEELEKGLEMKGGARGCQRIFVGWTGRLGPGRQSGVWGKLQAIGIKGVSGAHTAETRDG